MEYDLTITLMASDGTAVVTTDYVGMLITHLFKPDCKDCLNFVNLFTLKELSRRKIYIRNFTCFIVVVFFTTKKTSN